VNETPVPFDAADYAVILDALRSKLQWFDTIQFHSYENRRQAIDGVERAKSKLYALRDAQYPKARKGKPEGATQ
jgi:hypothetical protein